MQGDSDGLQEGQLMKEKLYSTDGHFLDDFM